jgi:hypothetical protein
MYVIYDSQAKEGTKYSMKGTEEVKVEGVK